MADGDRNQEEDVPAGGFAVWLRGMQRALRGDAESDVPCDGCTACCSSSQFVHIGPDETETLSRIPRQLLFAAPRMPVGHVVLGYDERGRCPMLTDGGCSIYAHRPRTCRAYDCRVFTATGLVPDDDEGLIARRARRWRFDFPTDADRGLHDAVLAAVRFVREREEREELAPANTTRLAVLAIEAHEGFPGHGTEAGGEVGYRADADPSDRIGPTASRLDSTREDGFT